MPHVDMMKRMGGCIIDLTRDSPSQTTEIEYPAVSNEPLERGWLCPRCGTVNAPWMPFCYKCTNTGERNVKVLYRCLCGFRTESLEEYLEHTKECSKSVMVGTADSSEVTP